MLVEQHQFLETDIADLAAAIGTSKDEICCGQRHFAIGGAGKGGHAIDLVIGEPGQLRGAGIVLPDVALGLLGQTHMLTQ